MPGLDLNTADLPTILGVVGGLLFFGRFYVQWIVSEIRGVSVIPVAFWYMSAAGVLLLFPYAFDRGSPGGTLGLCFNLVIYARNLVHIWRERGVLSRRRHAGVHVGAGILVTVALVLTAITWRNAYDTQEEFWLWSGMWGVGQALFFLRFLVQWAATEFHRRSTVPLLFWRLGIVGTLFHGAYFIHRGDWILAIGTIADGLVYVRNLYLQPKSPEEAPPTGG